jgi:hypothetical protein
MTIRELTVERRVVGTVNQAEEYHCHYVVRASEDAYAYSAYFMIIQVVTWANGSPSAGVFQAVSTAVRLFGRALAGADGTHDEHTKFRTNGAGYDIQYRDIPPIGATPPAVSYTLADVIASPGAPPQASFDAVVSALVTFGDTASGFVL